MEVRRLAILLSHLRRVPPTQLPRFFVSNCASAPGNEHRLRDCQKRNLQDDCVFCRIIRGESTSFKLYEDDICFCILDTKPLSCG